MPDKRLFGLCLITFSTLVGCQELNLRSQSPDKEDVKVSSDDFDDDEFETKIETPLIGDYTNVTGLNSIVLQSVGLVVGLDGTGGDPPPSSSRTLLREEMVRRGVEKPNEILRSPNTALVIVRAYLPPMVRDGKRNRDADKFDVEVRLPSNSTATSLNGGILYSTRLTEHAMVPGQGIMKGHDYAIAKGPVIVSTSSNNKEEDNSKAGLLRRGRIPGGATSTTERNLSLFLRNDFRSIRNAKRIADQVGLRFFHYNEYGQREPLAEALTDQKVELKVHPRYKENYARYLKVVRSIPLRETEVARRLRIEQLSSQLNDPPTSEKAALRLEAIGEDSIPYLKKALKNPLLEVRFHASMALAYLDDPSGVAHLAEAAEKEAAFRAFAFAALSIIDDAEAHLALRDLLDEPSAETRYGAFRALTILDAYDPFIAGDNLDDRFMLHTIQTPGDPLIHLTQRQRSEIVIFGADQAFETPLIVSAGGKIRVQGQSGADKIVVSRYEYGEPDQRFEVSPRIEEVIRTVVELGATYPDVVQMLVQAEAQHNLPGHIAIDALPASGRLYERPAEEDLGTIAGRKSGARKSRKARIGNAAYAPNLFGGLVADKEKPMVVKASSDDDSGKSDAMQSDADDSGANKSEASDSDAGKASAVDLRKEVKPDEEKTNSVERFKELFDR